VLFVVSCYDRDAETITQAITHSYPDAEVKKMKQSEFPNMKPAGYTLRAGSIYKEKDSIFPIKTYKYFEDDPLSSFTNAFGSLKKEDKAIFQLVLKPVGAKWNKKAKHAAGEVAKGQYKPRIIDGFIGDMFYVTFYPFIWFFRFFTDRDSTVSTNAP
jgi:hypothetical protein